MHFTGLMMSDGPNNRAAIGERVLRWVDVFMPPTRRGAAELARLSGWSPDAPNSYCRRCGATSTFAAMTLEGCPACRGRRLPWAGVWRLGAYQPPLSQWIVQYKFRTHWSWSRYFGCVLAELTPRNERAAVVPVPLHWTRRLLRGYDQSHLIAHAFAKAKGLPMAPLLRRRRRTAPQSHLHGHAERMANTRGAFTLAPVDLTGWTIWLIDDVTTTGATAKRCARLLRAAGAARINLAVVAVADRKQPPEPVDDP